MSALSFIPGGFCIDQAKCDCCDDVTFGLAFIGPLGDDAPVIMNMSRGDAEKFFIELGKVLAVEAEVVMVNGSFESEPNWTPINVKERP